MAKKQKVLPPAQLSPDDNPRVWMNRLAAGEASLSDVPKAFLNTLHYVAAIMAQSATQEEVKEMVTARMWSNIATSLAINARRARLETPKQEFNAWQLEQIETWARRVAGQRTLEKRRDTLGKVPAALVEAVKPRAAELYRQFKKYREDRRAA